MLRGIATGVVQVRRDGKRRAKLAGALLAVLLAGCTVVLNQALIPVSGQTDRQPPPQGEIWASPDLPSPTPAASASPRVTPAPSAMPVTTKVTISPPSARIYLPGLGSGDPVLASSTRFAAVVFSSDGATSDAVVWSSSNRSLVDVSQDGFVGARASTGSAIVTATSLDGLGTATAAIEVRDAGKARVWLE